MSHDGHGHNGHMEMTTMSTMLHNGTTPMDHDQMGHGGHDDMMGHGMMVCWLELIPFRFHVVQNVQLQLHYRVQSVL